MSRSALAALCLFLIVVSARAAEIPELIAAGDAALTNFHLPKATAAFKSALKLDNKNYDACWRLTRALVDAATLETDDAKKKLLLIEAQDYARGAGRLNPTGSKGHAFLAVVVGKLALYQGGRTKVELSKEVKTEAEKAIALDPQEDLAYHVLGVWNREMAQLNWLMRKFAEVLYGSFPPASMDGALKDLRKAAGLAPQAVAHQTELGITLADAGQWAEAKKTLEHALAMPKTWVTDDYYKKLAANKLKEVNRHLH
jgi:tetratricopeptide (TPR) repeat protein